jgi:uncharacterized low-complexity protein
MSNKTAMKPLAVALGAAFVTSLAGTTVASASDNPFAMTELSSGYMVAEQAEGKCGEGMMKKTEEGEHAEGMMKKAEEGKCGEGKCGEGMMKKKEAEGKCGAAPVKKEGEGKCGAGN